jgi:hypothetical protein
MQRCTNKCNDFIATCVKYFFYNDISSPDDNRNMHGPRIIVLNVYVSYLLGFHLQAGRVPRVEAG